MDGASFSKTLTDAMANFFAESRGALQKSSGEVDEIPRHDGRHLPAVLGGTRPQARQPGQFSLLRYLKEEIDRLEQWCDTHLATMVNLLTHEKRNIIQKFFDEVAVLVRAPSSTPTGTPNCG